MATIQRHNVAPTWGHIARLLSLVLIWGVVSDAKTAWGQFGGRGPSVSQLSNDNDDEAKAARARIPYYAPKSGDMVQDVQIIGNTVTEKSTIEGMLQTRAGRVYDPELAQGDVRRLYSSKLFFKVDHYTRAVQGGVSVTFEVSERPTVAYVRYIGNEKVKDKTLNKEVGVKEGDPLHRYTVEEGNRRIEELYLSKGYTRVHVEAVEGLGPADRGIVYRINEGPRQRISKTKIVGNNLDSDARLKTKIQSKPGVLWLFGGKINPQQLQEDEERLKAYYHSLGYFLARVTAVDEYDEKQKWATVTFVVDEGPRYRVRNVLINGNEKFPTDQIQSQMQVIKGDYYNLTRLQTDINMLRDLYGGEGYIFADIQTNPRFIGDSGELDIVYNIAEGQQYRIGQIYVNIEGDESHTRHDVVLNRLSISPGDIVDVREIRSSERRLQASQLFETNPTQGPPPQIVVKPNENGEAIARDPDAPRSTFRGQSPTTTRYRLPLQRQGTAPVVDLIIQGKLR